MIADEMCEEMTSLLEGIASRCKAAHLCPARAQACLDSFGCLFSDIEEPIWLTDIYRVWLNDEEVTDRCFRFIGSKEAGKSVQGRVILESDDPDDLDTVRIFGMVRWDYRYPPENGEGKVGEDEQGRAENGY